MILLFITFSFVKITAPDTFFLCATSTPHLILLRHTKNILLGIPWPSSGSVQFSSVQSLSHVRLFATPWTTARQASLSITNSQSLPKLISIESVMPSNHLIPCHPLFFLPSIFPSIRDFSNESALRVRWPKYWSFSFNILDLLEVQGTLLNRTTHSHFDYEYYFQEGS